MYITVSILTIIPELNNTISFHKVNHIKRLYRLNPNNLCYSTPFENNKRMEYVIMIYVLNWYTIINGSICVVHNSPL